MFLVDELCLVPGPVCTWKSSINCPKKGFRDVLCDPPSLQGLALWVGFNFPCAEPFLGSFSCLVLVPG